MEPEEIYLKMIHPIFHSLPLSASATLCVGTTPLLLSVSRCECAREYVCVLVKVCV